MTAIDPIDDLDLEPIVYKLTHPETGEKGLTLEQADRGVELYRCFLKLCKRYPNTPIVPSRQIDQIWHAHISDTAKYRVDCDTIFGRPLDHFPYAGMRGPEDERALRDNYANTRRLFAAEFGIDIAAEGVADCYASSCKHDDGGLCSNADCERASAAELPRPRPERS
jgi:hypothetical protein